MLRIDELIGAVDAAEGPSVTLDKLVAERLGGSSATRYTGLLTAARTALPPGWGYILDATPGRNPYCDAVGPKALGYIRVGASAATQELALLSAAMRAQKHVREQATLGVAH